MRDDFERQVGDGLSHLRSDVDQVHWSDAESVRRRGIQRARQRVATGTLAVVVGAGFVGVGAAGGFPGQNGESPLVSSPSSPTADSDTDPADGNTPADPGEQSPEDDQTTDAAGNDGDDDSPGDDTTPSGTPGGPTSPDDDPTTPDDDPTTPDDDEPSDTPTNTPTTPPDASDDALLAEDQMPVVNDSSYTWSETGTVNGEGGTPPVCADSDLADLGATDTMRRDFTWGTDGTVYGFNTLGVFESSDEAATAYGSYAGWVDGCTWGEVNGPTEVSVDDGQARWWWIGTETSETSGEIEVVGLVQKGAAVSVVVWHEESLDFNYSNDPMAGPLRASAALLVPYVVD